MNGKEKTSGEPTKPVNALLDGDYVGKEVVFIAFDKEKSAVTLDDNFVLIQAMEKKERIVKIVATIIACVCFVGIVGASIKLLQAGPEEQTPIVIATETPEISTTQEPTVEPTEEPTVEPTVKPTKKPKQTKKPKKATKEPVVVTEKPVVITEAPVITNAPVVTTAPKPTKDPFEEEEQEDPFEVES